VFNSMMKDLRRRKATGVLCWKLDRLTRNLLDAALISELLESGVISEIRTPSQIYRNTSNDKFMTGLDFIMAKKYIDDLSENVKRGLKTKAQMGWLPGRAPVGYLNPPSQQKGQRMIIKDPKRFPLLRKMWDLLLSGQHSVPEILRIANESWGFRMAGTGNTPERPLARTTLYKLFTDPFYAGRFYYSGELYIGKHEPMVTAEEYERGQLILGRIGRSRPKRHQFAFTGIFRCGQCGSMVTAEEKYKFLKSTGLKKRYVYYHCTHKKDARCKQVSIEETELRRQIDEFLATISIPQPYLEWISKHLDEVRKSERAKADSIIENEKRELKRVEVKLSNLLALKISPDNEGGRILSDEEYLAQKEKLFSEKAKLETILKRRGDMEKEAMELTIQTFNFAVYARIWFAKGDIKRQRTILTAASSNREFLNGKALIEAKKPLQVIERTVSRLIAKNATLEPPKFGLDNTQAAHRLDGLYAKLRELDDVRTEIRKILQNPHDHPEEMSFFNSLRQLQSSMAEKLV